MRLYNASAFRSEVRRLQKDLRRDILQDAERVVHETGEQFRIEVVRYIVKNKVIRTGRLLRSLAQAMAVRKIKNKAIIFTEVPYAKYADFYRGYFMPLAGRLLRGQSLNALIRRAVAASGVSNRRRQ